MAAGEPLGITPYGTETMHVLRAEKGFPIIGQDTDGTVTPQDLGMSWVVSKKKIDFSASAPHQRPDNNRADRKHLVGLLPDRPDHAADRGRPVRRDRTATGTPGSDARPRHVELPQRRAGPPSRLALLRSGRDRIGDTCMPGTPASSSGHRHRPRALRQGRRPARWLTHTVFSPLSAYRDGRSPTDRRPDRPFLTHSTFGSTRTAPRRGRGEALGGPLPIAPCTATLSATRTCSGSAPTSGCARAGWHANTCAGLMARPSATTDGALTDVRRSAPRSHSPVAGTGGARPGMRDRPAPAGRPAGTCVRRCWPDRGHPARLR